MAAKKSSARSDSAGPRRTAGKKRPSPAAGTDAPQTNELAKRNQNKEALRESEERYRTLFEQASDSIVVVDAKTGAILEFNQAAHENLGYTREEFEKLTLADVEAIESPEEVLRHTRKIVNTGGDNFETKQRTKTGEIRDIDVRTRVISIGGRDFIQSVFRDLTEQNRAKRMLEKAHAELERRVKQRTAELQKV